MSGVDLLTLLLIAVVGLFTATVALFTAYLVLLTAGAVVARMGGGRGPAGRVGRPRRFAVVVPAHNEATMLPALLGELARLDYPRPKFDVVVIADNCDDGTAAVALSHGARVFTRTDPLRRGKGFALGWAFERLLAERRHDAFVILDADSLPAPDLLTRLDAALRAGASAAQAYCAVGNAGESWRTALMAADMALVHYLRPAGRQALGGSADLQGNGICLTRAVLREVPWETVSIAEDHEYHLRLLFHGIHSVFVPDAVVRTVMEPTMATAEGQELRWEGGRMALARRSLFPLCRAAWRAGRDGWPYLDAALDLTTPPFALLAAGTAGMAALHGLAWVVGGPGLPAAIWTTMLAGQAFYAFVGCALAGVPARAYAALFVYGPLYAAGKVGCYLTLARGGARGWVPTPRRAETSAPERVA